VRTEADYWHTLAESFKHAFADRSRWMGDPAFVDVPARTLISDEYAKGRAATFNRTGTLKPEQYGTPDAAGGSPVRPDHGTSHFCVVDRWGSAVACTETVNLGFGSCLAVESYGIVLNDQMDDFTTHSGKANAFGLKQSDRNLPAPGKKPLSSMTPTIVLGPTRQVELVAGASGGPRIITATTQVILNVLQFRATAGDAVSWARMHHQWSPDVLRLEPGLMNLKPPDWTRIRFQIAAPDPPLSKRLETLGHNVEPIDAVANVQLIKRDGDRWDAACDPRKGGTPAGH
jgi:gamma-glutamyltranspeptidase/glutathione hydrolase